MSLSRLNVLSRFTIRVLFLGGTGLSAFKVCQPSLPAGRQVSQPAGGWLGVQDRPGAFVIGLLHLGRRVHAATSRLRGTMRLAYQQAGSAGKPYSTVLNLT